MSAIPPTSPPPATGSHDAMLRIIEGLHAGASRPLSRREMVLIGSGDDCDVVLADRGVAAHHALLNVVDGRYYLRALDAPLELPGHSLHPGDPVELAQVQRIGLGEAAIAFGRADATEWLSIAPRQHGLDGLPPQRPRSSFASRMPLIAGAAVLALAALAIFAAWMPAGAPAVDVERRLSELGREHRVSDLAVSRDVDGQAVLTGTVDDRATRDRLAAQLAREQLEAKVSLRTGEDLAVDVAEVMRSGGYPVQAAYIGQGNVRVTGSFGRDLQAVRRFIASRAMVETGVNLVEPVNLDASADDAVADAAAGAAPAKAHIVSVVRGEDPYIVDAEGNRYPDGALVPGWGKLVSISTHVHVLQPDGTLTRIVPSPAPPAEAADAAADKAATTGKAEGGEREAPGGAGPQTRNAKQRTRGAIQEGQIHASVHADARDRDRM